MIPALALLGSLWGLVSALVLSGIRFANSGEPERDLPSSAAFIVTYAAPFMLALAALFWRNAAQRASVWLAAGILALLASFTAFSGVSLIFLPAAPLLILAAIFSAARTLDSAAWQTVVPVLPVSLVLIGVGVAAFLALVTLTSDPGCWVLMRYADGHQAWQVAPPDVASIAVINGPNGQQVFGYGQSQPPNADGSSIVTSRCSSDIISPLESAVSVGLWILAGAGLLLFRRYWSASPVLGDVAKG